MKNLKNLFAFLILTLALSFSSCETTDTSAITVTGKVSNASGNGLQGVSVRASGGSTATTNASGSYTIDVTSGQTLTFSLIEYLTKESTISNQTTLNITLDADAWVASFASNGNSVADPLFNNSNNVITPSTVLTATSSTDAWYTTANYKGAIEGGFHPSHWYAGWSFFANIAQGITTSSTLPTAGRTSKVINDAWMQAQGTGTINWSKDTIYVLDGFVFVDANQTLDIQAGTIIQGKPGTGANASALIVTRDGMINANGTSSEPIVFTSEGDNGGTSASSRGQWGGLIILGKAGLNSSPGETAVEGLPTSDTRGLYGGSDNTHNSGTIKYVSIRHGGTNIGSDNEINGLTLGGVGSGTTIEYVEVIGNQDDGIEWFGGTVNAKYLIAAYCGDDALDFDEGYRGKNQFVIVYQDQSGPTADGDRGGEHDGGTTPETATPYATPKFWNVTSVGISTKKAITFRDNAGGEYHNSIFINYGKGIDIEDLVGQTQDSYKQFVDGNLKVSNCVFHNIGAGTTGAELFTTSN